MSPSSGHAHIDVPDPGRWQVIRQILFWHSSWVTMFKNGEKNARLVNHPGSSVLQTTLSSPVCDPGLCKAFLGCTLVLQQDWNTVKENTTQLFFNPGGLDLLKNCMCQGTPLSTKWQIKHDGENTQYTGNTHWKNILHHIKSIRGNVPASINGTACHFLVCIQMINFRCITKAQTAVR